MFFVNALFHDSAHGQPRHRLRPEALICAIAATILFLAPHAAKGAPAGLDVSTFDEEEGVGEPVIPSGGSGATEIGRTTARLNGVAIPNGLPTVGFFVYIVEGQGSGAVETPRLNLGAGQQAVSFSQVVTNLQCGTSYVFWVHAENAAGSDSSSRQFDTGFCGSAPIPNTGAASDLTETAATLNGSVDTGGLPTAVRFVWGLKGGSLNIDTPISIVSGGGIQNFSARIEGLQCHTAYGFLAWAENEAGWDTGSIKFFTTPPCDSGPPPFFADGFESGNLSAWTSIGPFSENPSQPSG